MKLTNRETIESCTAEWKGERDENGRPLVPDDILRTAETLGLDIEPLRELISDLRGD